MNLKHGQLFVRSHERDFISKLIEFPQVLLTVRAVFSLIDVSN